MIKICSRCNETKVVALFPKAPTCVDGYRSYCKSCNKIRLQKYHSTPEGKAVHLKGCRRWASENPNKVKAMKKKWRDSNKEACSRMSKDWGERNKGKLASYCAERRARIKQAIPSWSGKKAIQNLYSKASELGMEVDHIVPLSSKFVCGLHTIDNLQLLTPLDNASKGNFHWPHMPTSF